MSSHRGVAIVLLSLLEKPSVRRFVLFVFVVKFKPIVVVVVVVVFVAIVIVDGIIISGDIYIFRRVV